MAAEGADRQVRLASIVAIDVVGFSSMSEKDQRKAASHVEALRKRIESVVARNDGRVFNTAGDGFMLEFASAGAAVNAINELMDQRPKGEPAIRIGAHVGDVVVTINNDLLGHGVNVAARLQSLAAPNTALVSGEFRSMARSSPTAAFKAKGRQPLENINQKVATFAIVSSRQRFKQNLVRAVWCAGAAAIITGGVLAAPYLAPAVQTVSQMIKPQSQIAAAPAQEPIAATPPPPVEPAAALTANEAPAAAEPPKPGQILRDCESCPEMVVLPAGTFTMGSPKTETGRTENEGPAHAVILPMFAAGKYEVTFAEWDSCLAAGGCNGFSPADNNWGRGRRPVIGVSWQDAQSYVDWLNLQAGKPVYRLLSEAEWEYAARAGADSAYAFGPSIKRAQANFASGRSDPIGSYGANAFGLFDMHGNVWEWVADCYAANYALAPADGSAANAVPCKARVYRGGSYADKAPELRAANRRKGAPELRNATLGFRVARSVN